jgi:Cu/Ag efflux pump CusA
VIEKTVEYSVRNPLVIVFGAILVTGWGIHSLLNTPIDAIPDLSENQVIVFADWPGRSPREVEDQVTYPLSVNLQGLAGIKAIRATSEFGFSMVNIIFEDHIDFYFARQRILERLSTAANFLPAGVVPYLAPDANALGQIFWYTVEGDHHDLGRLRAIQDWFIRYQLYSVSGVAEVASVGGFPIEYQIDVDPNKLRAYGITLGELDSAVARSNSSVGGRVIQKANSEYLVRSSGWINSLADVEAIVIKSERGTPIFVRDVASVQFGSTQRRNTLEKNGGEAVGGVVLMRYGENPLDVTERIKAKIEQLTPGLPEGVRIVPFYDRTELINSAVETVTESLFEEMIVASLAIILVMWHFRSTLIICLMLPLAVLVSFIMMKLLGISSNIMSLSGIAISIGVLVDAAIVMVDQGAHTLHRHFGSQKVTGDTRELLAPALKTLGRPIFFSLLIMILSFIPVFALGGMEGRMFHPLAYTKTFALVGVSVMAITLVPALIPWFVRGRIRGEEESWIVRRVIEIYRPVLDYLLDHPWPVVWLTGILYILGAVPTGSQLLFLTALAGVILFTAWSSWREEEHAQRYRFTLALWASLVVLLGCGFAAWRNWTLPWAPFDNIWFDWLTVALLSIAGGLLIVLALARIRFLATGLLVSSQILVALLAQQHMSPLGREFMPPLNEGSILDMPVTIPRASVTQVADDLKARDMEIRAFPEVAMVVGKAGRAETPTDPAPPDMVETIINLRPREFWPKRELRYEDALSQTENVLRILESKNWLVASDDPTAMETLANDATMLALAEYELRVRALILQSHETFERSLGPTFVRSALESLLAQLTDEGKITREPSPNEQEEIADSLERAFGNQLATSLDRPGVGRLSQSVVDELAKRNAVKDSSDVLVLEANPLWDWWENAREAMGADRATRASLLLEQLQNTRDRLWAEHVYRLNWEVHEWAVSLYTRAALRSVIDKAKVSAVWQGEETPEGLLAIQKEAESSFRSRLFLWQKSKENLLKEMDSGIQVPGWGNIWTQPIINRVDMLATGVRTMLGVKVYGNDLYKIQDVASAVAEAIKVIPGAVDVFPDQIVGEGYLEITIHREKAARYGVSVGDIQDVVETALGGRVVTTTVEGRERFPVRIRYARSFREDEESVKNLLVTANRATELQEATARDADRPGASTLQIPLSQVADVSIVQGPSMIKSENGLLRAYVQLNVRDRDIVGFVEEAQAVVANKVKLPPGMYLEWSGQFEHQLRAKRTLSIVIPAVVLTIFILLFLTYHDLADSLMVLFLAVPGAIFGGVLFQYFFGFNFSVAVWVGFIACFGLATEGGLVILVYLREAINDRGGLENMTQSELREAVLRGAVQRTRPKLLTELTTMIGLAPMLWASGTGSEIIQPMAAPVLGGILVSDEVIDLLLPVVFYWERSRRLRRLQERGFGKSENKGIPGSEQPAAPVALEPAPV